MKSNVVMKIVIVVLLIATIVEGVLLFASSKKESVHKADKKEDVSQVSNSNVIPENTTKQEVKIDEWELTLVNYANSLPSDFEPELSNIDDTRKFDARVIGYLNTMFDAMKQDKVSGFWVQSSYRSIETQANVFDKQVKEYMNSGHTREKAEEMTLKIINKPGTSEHNLGLAVDFNYVNLDFENTKAFNWLKENAEDYGFILRYRKDKEDITKVEYEPWHWRYVGKEHAKKINELDMCLEEYIDYLKSGGN